MASGQRELLKCFYWQLCRGSIFKRVIASEKRWSWTVVVAVDQRYNILWHPLSLCLFPSVSFLVTIIAVLCFYCPASSSSRWLTALHSSKSAWIWSTTEPNHRVIKINIQIFRACSCWRDKLLLQVITFAFLRASSSSSSCSALPSLNCPSSSCVVRSYGCQPVSVQTVIVVPQSARDLFTKYCKSFWLPLNMVIERTSSDAILKYWRSKKNRFFAALKETCMQPTYTHPPLFYFTIQSIELLLIACKSPGLHASIHLNFKARGSKRVKQNGRLLFEMSTKCQGVKHKNTDDISY